MPGRAATRTATRGGVPSPPSPAAIRNVALVGPSGSGKTTLVEALLAHTGTIPRAGSVTEGSTVCDHDPAAVRQGRSVGLSVAPLSHGGVKINLIDTPGHGDFVGELRAGLRAADAALFVVPADRGGTGAVDATTVAQWEECAAVGMPRAVVVARCDAPRADVGATVAACRDAFGDGVALLYLPLLDGGRLTGLYGLLSRTPAERAPEGADGARAALIEGIIEQSEDESLLERYLGGEDIAFGTLVDDLETAVARGAFHPVVPVCAASGTGADALLELLAGGFPSPLEHPLPPATGIDGSPLPPLTADPDGPLAAEVVRTTADAYVGRVSLVRVFSGTLRPDTVVHVSGHHAVVPAQRAGDGGSGGDLQGHDADERLAHVHVPLGATLHEVDAVTAGDIAALTRLGSAQTGDTLSAADRPLLLSCWDLPEPLLPVAVVAGRRGDEDALVKALLKIVAADPRCAWSATGRPTRPCCGARVRRTRTWCCPGCGPGVRTWRSSRCGSRCARRWPGRCAPPGGTSSRAAGTGSTPSATSSSSRCHAARGSSSSPRSWAGPCRRRSSPASRRACGPSSRAGSASTTTPSSTSGRGWSTGRRTASTPPTPPSGPRARSRCARRPRRPGRCCSNPWTRSPCASPTSTWAPCSATCRAGAGACSAPTPPGRGARSCAPRCRARSCCATPWTCAR